MDDMLSDIPIFWWNYIESVLDYYPEDYIQENMWDLTHSDYDDNAFSKAYEYHMGKTFINR